MAKKIRKLLFLKSTGVLIGEITDDVDTSVMDLSQFYTKNVEIDEDNEEYWHGDFSTGTVKSRLTKPLITESQVKYYSNLKALEQYPIHRQINVIVDMLDKSGIPQTEAFMRMREFLQAIREEHNEKISVYASNPDVYTWVSESEEHLQTSKKVI
jgi:hypothetical protein